MRLASSRAREPSRGWRRWTGTPAAARLRNDAAARPLCRWCQRDPCQAPTISANVIQRTMRPTHRNGRRTREGACRVRSGGSGSGRGGPPSIRSPPLAATENTPRSAERLRRSRADKAEDALGQPQAKAGVGRVFGHAASGRPPAQGACGGSNRRRRAVRTPGCQGVAAPITARASGRTRQ